MDINIEGSDIIFPIEVYIELRDGSTTVLHLHHFPDSLKGSQSGKCQLCNTFMGVFGHVIQPSPAVSKVFLTYHSAEQWIRIRN